MMIILFKFQEPFDVVATQVLCNSAMSEYDVILSDGTGHIVRPPFIIGDTFNGYTTFSLEAQQMFIGPDDKRWFWLYHME